jgi:hypothetical protein
MGKRKHAWCEQLIMCESVYASLSLCTYLRVCADISQFVPIYFSFCKSFSACANASVCTYISVRARARAHTHTHTHTHTRTHTHHVVHILLTLCKGLSVGAHLSARVHNSVCAFTFSLCPHPSVCAHSSETAHTYLIWQVVLTIKWYGWKYSGWWLWTTHVHIVSWSTHQKFKTFIKQKSVKSIHFAYQRTIGYCYARLLHGVNICIRHKGLF